MASVDLKEIDLVDSMPIEPDASEDAMLPRIGDAYQAEIPSLIERSEYLSWDPIRAKNQARYLGLAIEVTWIDLNHPIPCKNPTKKETRAGGNDNLSAEDKYLVPMSPSGAKWTEEENASLVFGLYIFRKNFVDVKRFMKTKEMGGIQTFYYGEYYGSDEYNRWSDWRRKNKNSMKYVHGQRIFSGPRHQELLSRLLPSLTEENRNALSEVSKNFVDEKMVFVDYLSSLKFIVGIDALVKAIGIGKGKRDLTRMALETSKSNSIHPKIPIGKACSSLTTSEIIKFLSGDYRLSKARSNDLFWEAVWPRLLARGWHSEQPRDQACIYGVKVCLVFLVPGVKKFSRRKLVKGEHYYDSVPDVLSKVAKEPEIIELGADIEINGKNEEDNDDDSSPLRQKHHYLQPRTPNRIDDVMVFTVVDTSLSGGKIRELRRLPTEISISLNFKDLTQRSNEETAESAETSKRKSKEISVGCLKSEKNLLEGKNKKQKQVVKSHLSQKLKRENGEHVVPVKKRFKKETDKSGLGPRMENGISTCSSRPSEFPDESLACDTSGNEIRALIDLNVPQVSPELGNGLPVTAQETRRRSKTENVNPRRQSTRNRPPTTKALEALAYGYF